MIAWFRRLFNKTKKPSIKIIQKNEKEIDIEIDWPNGTNGEERLKVIDCFGRSLAAITTGIMNGAVAHKITEKGLSLNDKYFSMNLVGAMLAYQSMFRGEKPKGQNKNQPLIKPYQVIDIRNQMLQEED